MADVAELIVALKLQDGVSSGLGRLNGQLSGMGAGLSQVGRGIGQVGAGIGTIATRGAVAAAAGLTAVVTAAVSFEDAFAGVRKTVDATEGEFGILEDRLREMARTMPVSFEELAGIAEQGGALGIAFEGLDEFTKVVADLAATTDLTADTAATSLGVLGNVLGLSADDFDNFGSALVDLGNKGASTESAILSIAERIGATGSLIGLTSDQVLGFGAAVANVGIEAEAGGSALQRFFIDSLTAVESGGEDLETFARTAGVTAETFRDAFREDAGAALADFIEGLGKLPEAVQIQTLQDLGFNDVRITRTLLGLAGDADNLTDSLSISAQAFAENSALGEEAAKRYATFASQLKILKQNVIDAAVVIGDELLPVVGELTTEFVGFLNKPETRAAIKDFAESLAGGIREFVTEIRKADFGPLIDTMKGAAEIAKAAFDAFRGLPPGLQSLAIAALVANRVTGGAVGQIAGGLAGIAGGLIKIAIPKLDIFTRGSTPANPLFVSAIGGLGGGVPSAGPAGGIGRLALGLTGAGIAALLAEEFSDEIQGLGADIHDSYLSWLPTSGLSARDLEWPFGPKNTPRILPEIFGGNGLLGGTGAFTPPRSGSASTDPSRPRDLPDAVDKLAASLSKMLATLPDTAMAPIAAAITGGSKNLGAAILRFEDGSSRALGKLPSHMREAIVQASSESSAKLREGGNPPDAGNFVETVKLDASQVTDLREPTRLAFEELQRVKAELAAGNIARNIVRGTDVTSLRIDRLNSTMDLERAASAAYQAADAARIQGLRDSHVTAIAAQTANNAARLGELRDSHTAAIAGVSGRLDVSNVHLANISAKNFTPIIKNETVISPTVIQTSLTQTRIMSGLSENRY